MTIGLGHYLTVAAKLFARGTFGNRFVSSKRVTMALGREE